MEALLEAVVGLLSLGPSKKGPKEMMPFYNGFNFVITSAPHNPHEL